MTRTRRPGRRNAGTPRPEPAAVGPDGSRSDAEIWADLLGDDTSPWDTDIREKIAELDASDPGWRERADAALHKKRPRRR